MRRIFCDRCSKDTYSASTEISITPERKYDLCNSCFNKLKNFMIMRGGGDEEKK